MKSYAVEILLKLRASTNALGDKWEAENANPWLPIFQSITVSYSFNTNRLEVKFLIIRENHTCPLELTHDITRGKWKPMILWQLGKDTATLAQLERDIKGVSQLLGVIVEDFQKVTPDMITITVPEAEYAVFTTPPVNNISPLQQNDDPLSIAVKETWKYIFNEWFPNSDYQFDETKMDFEFYDERCHGTENSVMEIYVPITHKSA